MSAIVEKLRGEALLLPTQDRAELAYSLIRSLDNEHNAETSAVWEVELDRKWHEMENREVIGEPAEDVLRPFGRRSHEAGSRSRFDRVI